jgi:hypothetical protein
MAFFPGNSRSAAIFQARSTHARASETAQRILKCNHLNFLTPTGGRRF